MNVHYPLTGIGGLAILQTWNASGVRDEVSAWVTLIGSAAITITTIGLQIYRAIRDRDNDKKGKR